MALRDAPTIAGVQRAAYACRRCCVVAACAGALPFVPLADAAGLPSGIYVATRADVTVAGGSCDIGVAQRPAFVLVAGEAARVDVAGVDAILRDDAGVAMPLLSQPDGSHVLGDLTQSRDSPDFGLGQAMSSERHGTVSLDVDYRRADLDCRVFGTLVFERVGDRALADQANAIASGLALAGRRNALRAAGQSRQALEPARAAEAVLVAALGRDHLLAINAVTNIGSLHWDLDEFPEAKRRHEDAIARLSASVGASHFHTLRARGNLALVVWDLGDLGAAESMLRAVTQRYDTLLDPDDLHRLGTLVNLGSLLNQRGSHTEAEQILLDVVARYERLLGPDHPRTMVARNNLAAMLSAMGRSEDAFAEYGTVAMRYERALGPRHPAALRARHNRATMMARLRREGAIDELRAVLQLRREVIGARHSETLFTQANLALQLAASGNVDEAVALQREVLEGREAVSGAANLETLRAQIVLGQMQVQAGDVAAGIARMESAQRVAAETHGAGNRLVLEFGARLGTAQRLAGNLMQARAIFEQVVAGVEVLRETGAASPAARRDLFAPWAPTYKELAAVQLALGDAHAAFAQAERSKARMLVETLSMRRGETASMLPAEALTQLQAIDRELSAAETEVARAARGSSAWIDHERRRAAIADEARALRAALRERHPRYAELSQPRILPHGEGARELPRDALFVSYVRSGDRVLAFTLDRSGTLVGRDLGAFPGLDDTVVAYRTLLAGIPGSAPVWRRADGRYVVALSGGEGAVRVGRHEIVGTELAKRLVAPLRELDRHRRLVVSPDGALALLPFETLPRGGRPLVAAHVVSYAPSLTVYALTARRGRDYDRVTDRAPLYAMGAALYGTAKPELTGPAAGVEVARLAGALSNDPAGPRRAYDAIGLRWPDLPTSGEEIRRVASHFRSGGPVTLRTQAAATEAQLLADNQSGALARHRYVLLSAHGYLSTEAPSLSAVVLGQHELHAGTDGYVTAAEWTSYTLRSDLIVISACETGVGPVIEGEGVAGLPYALFVAGNRNVLLTLWPVADTGTALFVSRFFAHVRAGKEQATALALTKREFARGRYASPLFWAPFVLYGS